MHSLTFKVINRLERHWTDSMIHPGERDLEGVSEIVEIYEPGETIKLTSIDGDPERYAAPPPKAIPFTMEDLWGLLGRGRILATAGTPSHILVSHPFRPTEYVVPFNEDDSLQHQRSMS